MSSNGDSLLGAEQLDREHSQEIENQCTTGVVQAHRKAESGWLTSLNFGTWSLTTLNFPLCLNLYQVIFTSKLTNVA